MGEPAVLQNKTSSCWICWSNENNMTLTKLNGEQLLRNCKTYLDTLIIIESFENDTTVSCCNYCCESASQLTNLEKQVEKLQKEISDFSLLFSKTVVQRRSLVENEKGRNHNRCIQQIEKCYTIQNNPDGDSIVILDHTIVKTEVNEIVSKELHSDSHIEKHNLVTNSWFDTDDIENVTEDECENVDHSNDEIDVKYSCDDTFSTVDDIANKEILSNQQLKLSTTNVQDVQKKKTMSMSDLLKSVKMPVIQLERYLPERSKSSTMVVDGVGEENPKHENALEYSSVPNNCPETLSTVLPFKCREITCAISFRLKWDLIRHEKIHSRQKPYKCSICSKSFARQYHLTAHERLHSVERPFKCHLCEKAFKRSSNLKAHIIIHSERRPFKCSFCHKSFKLLSGLSAHETVHSEKTAYKCSFCGKSFKSSSSMSAHEKIHSAITPYKCSFCEKSFKMLKTLNKHEEIHSEEKSYKCSLCEKSFQRRGKLKEHIRVHTGDRPFKCSFCSKSFYHAADAKRHEKIHTGERPHKCSFCSKSFHRLDEAKLHEMTHTGEKPHKCSSCGKTFRSRFSLNYHYKREHVETENIGEYILS